MNKLLSSFELYFSICLLVICIVRFHFFLYFFEKQKLCQIPLSSFSKVLFHAPNTVIPKVSDHKSKVNIKPAIVKSANKSSQKVLKTHTNYFLKKSFPKFDKVLSNWWLQ